MAWMKVGTTTLAPPTPTYETDFSSSTGWTQVGSDITINSTSNKVVATDVDGTEARIYRAITLSDNKWVVDFDYKVSRITTDSEHQPIALSAGSDQIRSTSQDYLGFDVYAPSNTVRMNYRNGTTNGYGGTFTPVINTQYYVRLIRDGTGITLQFFTNSARTGTPTLSATMTVPATVVGFTHAQITGWVGSSGTGSDWEVDNLKIWNGITDASGASDNLDITGKTVRKFNQFLHHEIPTGGDANIMMTLNNDATQKYARRTSHNGGSDGVAANESNLDIGWGNADPKFYVHYWIDIAGEEKLGIAFGVNRKSAGAGNATQRVEHVLKYTDTSASITRVDTNNTLGGSYKAGSNISALGTD